MRKVTKVQRKEKNSVPAFLYHIMASISASEKKEKSAASLTVLSVLLCCQKRNEFVTFLTTGVVV